MIQALGTKLIVERVEQEQTSESGIFLSNLQDPHPMAEVVSVGDQVKIAVTVGDRVAISWNNTATQKFKGRTYYIVDESGVFGKLL